MRKCTALLLAAVILLLAACSKQPEPEPETDAQTSLTHADESQSAPAETTQTEPQTQAETETEPETLAPTTKPPVTTTLPPVTTTTPPVADSGGSATNPPEKGSEPFTARYVRIRRRYAENFVPVSSAVDSREGMLDAVRTFADLRSTDAIPEYAQKYTDEWFRTNRLIVVLAQESSGSVRHDVRNVTYTESGATVRIDRRRPDVFTCDVAHWLIFIELPDTYLHGGDPIYIIWDGQEPEPLPAPAEKTTYCAF